MILAAVYYQDCLQLSAEDFEAAVSLHRKTSKFFPMPAEIIDLAKQVQAERRRNTKQLEEPELTDEQIKSNLEHIKRFRRKMKIKTVPEVKNVSKKGDRYPNLKTKHAQTVRDQAQKILGGN